MVVPGQGVTTTPRDAALHARIRLPLAGSAVSRPLLRFALVSQALG
jgi:hypothetical protein